MTCKYCNKDLIIKRATKKYCSSSCRQMDYIRRLRWPTKHNENYALLQSQIAEIRDFLMQSKTKKNKPGFTPPPLTPEEKRALAFLDQLKKDNQG